MVRVAHRVDPRPVRDAARGTHPGAAAHRRPLPPVQRRSRFPERMPWVRLTSEPYPAPVRGPEVKDEDGATYIGPFSSASTAQLAVEALHESSRSGGAPSAPLVAPARVLRMRARRAGQMRCAVHRPSVSHGHADVVAASGTRCSRTTTPWWAHADRIAWLAAQERFEGPRSSGTGSVGLRGATRAQRFAPLASCPELVAASPCDGGGGRSCSCASGAWREPRASTGGPIPARPSPPCRRRGAVDLAVAGPRPRRSRRRPSPDPRVAREARRAARRRRASWASPFRSAESLGRPRHGRRPVGPPAGRHRDGRPCRSGSFRRPAARRGAWARRGRGAAGGRSTSTTHGSCRSSIPRARHDDDHVYRRRAHRLDTARIAEVAATIATSPRGRGLLGHREVDLIAIVHVREHDDLADIIADKVSKIKGVLRTQTYIAFRTYSQHDLEQAFALGLED